MTSPCDPRPAIDRALAIAEGLLDMKGTEQILVAQIVLVLAMQLSKKSLAARDNYIRDELPKSLLGLAALLDKGEYLQAEGFK